MESDLVIDLPGGNNNNNNNNILNKPHRDQVLGSSRRRKRCAPQRIQLDHHEAEAERSGGASKKQGKMMLQLEVPAGQKTDTGSQIQCPSTSSSLDSNVNSCDLPTTRTTDSQMEDDTLESPSPPHFEIAGKETSPLSSRTVYRPAPVKIAPSKTSLQATSLLPGYGTLLTSAANTTGTTAAAAALGTIGNVSLQNLLALLIQQPQLASPTVVNLPIGTVAAPSGELNSDLSNLLNSLSPPSPKLPSYSILLQQYLTIVSQCHTLSNQMSQYTSTLHHAKLTATAQENAAAVAMAMLNCQEQTTETDTELPPAAHSQPRKVLKERLVVPPSSSTGTMRLPAFSSTTGSASPKKGFSRKAEGRPLTASGKKPNFRGTSELENRMDPNFKDIISSEGVSIQLCYEHPGVVVPRDVYESLVSKAAGSATRLIRLLMKHFFSQKELARSSLSGEGQYKHRLNPEVTQSIKNYIRRRNPDLRTGTINLCMTDVCVQARRVSHNQLQRISHSRRASTDELEVKEEAEPYFQATNSTITPHLGVQEESGNASPLLHRIPAVVV